MTFVYGDADALLFLRAELFLGKKSFPSQTLPFKKNNCVNVLPLKENCGAFDVVLKNSLEKIINSTFLYISSLRRS